MVVQSWLHSLQGPNLIQFLCADWEITSERPIDYEVHGGLEVEEKLYLRIEVISE